MSLTRFVATLLLVGLAAPALAQSDRPNIVFIFSDDHAYQAIGAYGSRINQTPNIDRIAREGMRFENAMVTNSICAPSRAVIQTGKYSHLNGVLDNRQVFDGSQQTFPKLLQQAGYQTAMVGKWHLKSEPTGFDYWEVLPGQGSYYNPDFRVPGGEKRHYGYVTDIITDLTLAWLEDGRDPDRPFMVMTQNKAPHRGWMSGPVPILQGETPSDWRTSFYYHYYEHGVHNVAPHEGVRTERQKLIHYYETDEWELFDLATDPNEMRSVYGDETYSDTHDALLAELERLKADVGVPGTP